MVRDGRLNRDAVQSTVFRTAQIRNLALRNELAIELVNRSSVRADLVRQFEKEADRPKLDALSNVLKKLKQLSPDADLYAILVDFLSSEVAGYYDPQRKVMRIVMSDEITPGGLDLLQRVLRRDIEGEFLLAHELTHALDDQHFGLEAFTKARGNGDASSARKAFAEGEAMLVATHFIMGRPMKKTAGYAPPVPADASGSMPEVPAILRREIEFEYVDGMRFAAEVERRRGTRGLDAVYLNPPRSSEEVLHPEKFFAQNDAPVAVTFESDPPEFLGLERIDDDTMGEIGLLALLQHSLGKAGAKVAAGGWGGDRYRLYRDRSRPGVVGLVVRSVWDTPSDQVEFTDNVEMAFTRMYGAKTLTAEGVQFWVDTDTRFEIRQENSKSASLWIIPKPQ